MTDLRSKCFDRAISFGGLFPVAGRLSATEPSSATPQPETFRFAANDWIPNNPHLPALVYRRAVPTGGADPAARFEHLFARNGWPAQWRNGIYEFHHFHPSTHEVLGIARGSARVLLGGPLPRGRELDIQAGDVLVLPAGTGHCKLEASADFLVVGGYPPNQDTSISREALSEGQWQAMLNVSFPPSDPLCGPAGPLTGLWRTA